MLVGRESELLVLERLLAGARVGDSGVLVVSGEPGIGKTALLEHARRHTEGMRVLTARGVEAEHEVAFGGLSQLLTPLLHLLPDLPAPQAEALGVALALRDGPRPERFAVGAAVLGLLARAAEDRPLAVLVDDAHLLDESSTQALVFAARRLRTDPVALVVAQRQDPASALSNLEVLRLGPLDLEATRALLLRSRAWAGSGPALGRFHEATAGNPLAIMELAAEADRLLRAPPGTALPLAGELQATFLRRVGSLSAAAGTVLLLAAADSHDLATVERACGQLGVALAALEEAESAGLVRVAEGAVEFRHPLVRAAVYGAAAPATRREVHRALADAVAPREAARRAWHRAEAALGPDEEAAGLLETVAAGSVERGANAEAGAQYERAAALTADTEARAARLLLAGEQAWLGGATDRAARLLERSLDLAGSPGTRARAMLGLADVQSSSGSLTQAQDLQLAAADLVREDDLGLAARALGEAVAASLYLCDTASAGRVADRLLALTGPTAPPLVDHLGRLAAGVALVLTGEADRGPALIRDALAHPVQEGADAPWRLRWDMIGPLFLRETGENRQAVADVLQKVRDRVAVGALPFLLTLIAKDLAAASSWSQSDELYAEAVRLAEETGHVVDRTLALAGWSLLEARCGRVEPARAHALQALALGAEHDVHLARIWALGALADEAAAGARVADALAAYEELAEELDRLGVSDPDLSPVPELVELRRQTSSEGSVAAAEAFLEAAARKGQPWALARAHRALALALGDGRAEAEFAAALELHARTPDAFETARTQLAYGAHLRRTRRRVEARPVLRAALATFEQLGAAPWADRAAAELDATGETALRRGAGPVTALTPQERQVAALLTQGRTTREAAAALFLSPKTVEYHLRHVYLKLGIRSREELARALATE
ncbi:LuxR family transcriptional regulator [Phycicoccus ginsengisoli]